MKHAVVGLMTFGFGLLPAWAGEDASSGFFRTPSDNIYCYYSIEESGSVDCEIRDITSRTPTTERPADCDLEWGNRFSVKGTGYAELICAGDTTRDSSAVEFPYGGSYTLGSVYCDSAATGLTCRNQEGHGFFLSKARQELF